VDGEKIYVMGDVGTILSLNKTTHHDITVLRDGEKIVFDDLLMAHTEVDAEGNEYLHYGFTYGKPQDIKGFDKVGYVWKLAMDDVRMVRLSLQMLFNGQAKFSDVSGPVGIVSIIAETGETSETTADAAINISYLAAFIAVNLAVMNLLPAPALDGGRIFLLAVTWVIEKIIRKKIDPKYEAYVHAAGMILLLLFIAFITFKDIWKLFAA
jgi:regulator of sigma E protease